MPEPPAAVAIRNGSGQSGTVGQALAQAIVARVTDAEGRGVAGVTVTFAAGAGHGALAPATSVTDDAGEARSTWMLGTQAGAMIATASVAGLVPATAGATAEPGPPARLGFVSVPRSAVAGTVIDPPVRVAVEDQYGNRVPHASAQVTLTLGQGQLGGPATAAAADGVATFPGLHIAVAAPDHVLTAAAAGLAAAASEPFPVATGVAAELRPVAGEGQVTAAGSAVAVAPTVVVRDASGNAVAGVSVAFTVMAGGGSVAPEAIITAGDGTASAAWTLGTQVGGNALRATAAALPGVSVEFQAVAVPGPVDPSTSKLTAAPTTVMTGATSVVTVTARDAFGNPVSGAEVELSATGTSNTIVQPPKTGDDGSSSGTFRSNAAGSRTISAVVAGVALAQQVTVLVESPPEVAEVVVTPGDAGLLVGQTIALSAAALDDEGDPVPGAAVSWSSSDPGVASVSAAGVVTAEGPGAATITATSDGRSGAAEVSVSLNGGTLTNVTYCTMDGVAVKMDVYIPDASKPRPLPVVVHVHGGGWTSGSKSSGSRFAEMRPILLDRGYLVASLDYRLAPTHKYPAQIQDVKCAVRHLRARAWRYGLDPDRIGAWGGSAGGQLVSLLGTAGAAVGFDDVGGFQGESSEVRAVAAISAITDFTHPDELLDDYRRAFQTWPDPTSPEMIQASPVTHVSAGDASFFLIVGEDDALVLPAQSERLHQMLQAAGVPSTLLTVLNADHDLQPTDGPTEPSGAAINSRLADFFDQHLR